jgi:sulfate adenylyltransferase subunit 2
MQKRCGLLKALSILEGLIEERFDAPFGDARPDEEKSPAEERVYSLCDSMAEVPKNQRPELRNLFNGRHRQGEGIPIFSSFRLQRTDLSAATRYCSYRPVRLLPRGDCMRAATQVYASGNDSEIFRSGS